MFGFSDVVAGVNVPVVEVVAVVVVFPNKLGVWEGVVAKLKAEPVLGVVVAGVPKTEGVAELLGVPNKLFEVAYELVNLHYHKPGVLGVDGVPNKFGAENLIILIAQVPGVGAGVNAEGVVLPKDELNGVVIDEVVGNKEVFGVGCGVAG